MREIMAQLHQGNHWEIQAMCDAILRAYVCTGIYTLAKQVIKSCLTCRKVNKPSLRGQLLEGRSPGLWPFQSIQMDCKELLQGGILEIFTAHKEPVSNQLG
jgi:hypothetical protein